jgi:hypothetical protein
VSIGAGAERSSAPAAITGGGLSWRDPGQPVDDELIAIIESAQRSLERA